MTELLERRSQESVTVALMGLDGTGKSTQAEALERSERASGRRVTRIHHASTKTPIVGLLKRRYHSRLIALLKRQGSHVQWTEADPQAASRSGGAVGALIGSYLLAGSFLKTLWYRGRYRRRTVVLDRCLLDDIVKVRWRFGVMARLGNLLMRFAPRPDVVVVFAGDPEVTFERKKTRNCSYAEYLAKGEVLSAVLREAAGAGWRIVDVSIDGKSPAEVHERVLELRAGAAGA